MAPNGEAEVLAKALSPAEAVPNGDAFGCVAAKGDSLGCFAANGDSLVCFAPNGDSPGFAVAKPLKPPPPEKELKPPPLDAAALAPNGFAGELDCPSPDSIAPNPDFPNCGCPGVLGVPNDAPG